VALIGGRALDHGLADRPIALPPKPTCLLISQGYT
jgi:hypothetical protein